MSQRNELAAKRGYHYRMSRRAFLVSASAAALAACAPSGSTGNAASSGAATAAATAGKAMKIGQLLPFTKVYAELGNSMKRATDLYLKQKGGKLAGRTIAPPIYEDEANDPTVGAQKTQKFIEQDQVDVMMGIVATPIAYAVRNAIDAAKLVFIETNAGGNALTRTTTDCKPACKSKFIFRASFSSWATR